MNLIVTRTGLSAADFQEVTLVKQVAFTPAESLQAALEALGNDQEALLKIINSGLAEKAKDEARDNSAAWRTYKLDEQGEIVTENGVPVINGEFTGSLVDSDKLNMILLPMAKNVKGENGQTLWPEKGAKGDTAKMKRDAREKALELIKGNPALMAILS